MLLFMSKNDADEDRSIHFNQIRKKAGKATDTDFFSQEISLPTYPKSENTVNSLLSTVIFYTCQS